MCFSIEFKKECAALLTSSDSLSCEEDDSIECGEAAPKMDCDLAEELAVITAPRVGMPSDFRCSSHKFRPENIVTIPRRFNPKDFESKMNLIRSCPNLRVLCMVGIDQRLQKLAVDNLTLSHFCPKIEHFILDGGLLDLAIAYQEDRPDMIRVLEVKNDKETEEEVIHLITKSSNIRSVFLTHSTVEIIEQIVPQVTSLSLSWITDNEFQSLIRCSRDSHITDLMLETVDLTMDAEMIGQLAEALPQLQFVKLSGPLEHIHGLHMFRNLRHVVFDAECQSKQTIDPNFPIDMSRALELSRQKDNGHDVVVKEEDDDDEENLSQHNTSCQIGLNKFFESCGENLISFSITIRERFKKDFFYQLKRECPLLQELTVLSVFEQFFDPKALSLPSLLRLSLQFIRISDTKLIEVLDICRNLTFISIEKPQKISSACIRVLRYYGEEIFAKRQSLSSRDKFTAIIQTEGRVQIEKRIRNNLLDISFKQKAVAEISNRLRYKY